MMSSSAGSNRPLLDANDKRSAIITFVVGDKYQENFASARRLWERYCARYDIDLIVVDQFLDDSDRARQRSPAWQKCLLMSDERLLRYDQVAWVDSDILIMPAAPDIFAATSPDRVAAVDQYATPSKEIYQKTLQHLYDGWRRAGVRYVDNATPALYHSVYGLDAAACLTLPGVVQTGVIVFNPSLHRSIFRAVYDDFEERGGPEWNYEMRPLSFTLQQKAQVQWIDPRFNFTVGDLIAASGAMGVTQPSTEAVLKSILLQGWFVHFASCQHLFSGCAAYVNTLLSPFDV